MYTRGRPKSIFSFSAVNENADENEIPFTVENETKTKKCIHFRPKNENESHLIILVFFSIHSLTKSAYNAPPIPRPVSPYLQLVLVDGIPLSSCTVYRYLYGIFLDDISTHEQFAFLVYCYRVKAIFHNLCTVIKTFIQYQDKDQVCVAQQIAPLVNTLSTEADVHEAQKVLSNNGFRMANCFCCLLSLLLPWCALLTGVKYYNKSLEKL